MVERAYSLQYPCGSITHFDLDAIIMIKKVEPPKGAGLYGQGPKNPLYLAETATCKTLIEREGDYRQLLKAWRTYKNQLNAVLQPMDAIDN